MTEQTVESVVSNEPVVKSDVEVKTERDARQFGWVPREEFRGTDEEWVDADAFVRRGKEINPILRKNNETLLKKLEQANAEIAEVKKVAKEFEKFQKEQAEHKISDMETQIAALKQSKKDAIRAGDGDEVVAIDDAIDNLKAEKAAAQAEVKQPSVTEEEQKPSAQVLDPLVVTWMDKNEWFGANKRMTAVADVIGRELNTERPDLRGQDFFNELDKRLQEEYPEKLGKKERPNPVEGNRLSASRSSGTKGRSYAGLPADAKQACDRFVKQGLTTQEQYVADYAWD